MRLKASSWFDHEPPKRMLISNEISFPSSEQSATNLPLQLKGDLEATFQGEQHPEYLVNSPSFKPLTCI